MYQNREIVIFGASGGASKIAKTLDNLSIGFQYFSDNDSKKWGMVLLGKEVIEPSRLAKMSCCIVIASMYYSEIYNQLLDMGIQAERIVTKEEVLISYFDAKSSHFVNDEMKRTIHYNKSRTIILDMSEGYELSGATRWTMNLASGLIQNNENFIIFSRDDEFIKFAPAVYLEKQELFGFKYEEYGECIQQLVNSMIKKLPFTLVISTISQNFMAAYIVKKFFPDAVRIISVIHSDFLKFYDSNAYIEQWVDRFVCVSEKIESVFCGLYNIEKYKIFSKSNPVLIQENIERKYPQKGDCIHIAYAARLEKAQKRSELIPKVIELLEKSRVDYHLSIAGDGSCAARIENYVKEWHLEKRVSMLGTLRYKEMDRFWQENDIFINVSDCEGMSLAMLEAMSFGLAPVVTNTSGVKSIIIDGVNGYVSEILDMEALVNNIVKLVRNPEQIREFGEKSREIVKENCNVKSYAKELIGF